MMTMNRRSFLKQIGAGAAGLGLVSFLPGCRSLSLASSGLPRSTPEAEGISSRAIIDFINAAAERKVELHSFMMVRHGRVVAEGWWKPYGPELVHTLYSLSKSFTSTAIGFAVSEGRLTVDDRVTKFFPDDLPKEVSENLTALRVRDLLSMSVGNEKEPTHEMVKEENWVKHFLAAPITHKPGSVFMYNSAATYMCSAIVQKLTGQRIVDYLRPRLFEPLGIEKFSWETCPRGINTGGWGLSLQSESLAKFGQTLLQKGNWSGRQIIPAAWVAEATTKKIQQPHPENPGRPNAENDWLQGYCYQFWRCQHNAFRGDGAFGQFMVVMPEQDAVFVMTAESNAYQGQLDLFWRQIFPAIKNGPLSADAASEKQLRERVSSLALAMPAGKDSSPVAWRSAGKRWKLESNDLGLGFVEFEFMPPPDGMIDDLTQIAFHGNDAIHKLPFGLGRWREGETNLSGTPPRLVGGFNSTKGTMFKTACAGAWKDDNTFEMMVRYIETPHHDTITCKFDDDKVEISFMNSIAALGPNPKDSRPILKGRTVNA